MPKCQRVQRKNRAVCIGDMRDKIILQSRSITAPSANGSDMTESFVTTKTVWSLVETRQGIEIFDGTNLIGVATHYFYIRYVSGLTAETWIQFKSKYYDILDVQNLEERNEFMLLRCSERGTTSKASNYA